MSGPGGKSPSLVFVLKDGIRGHENQSAGVAWWLGESVGAQTFDLEIPGLSGLSRIMLNKIQARKLRYGHPGDCLKWLKAADRTGIYASVTEKMAFAGASADEVLFLSAGSSGAPFCLTLARATGGKCSCIMTPAVLGTEPFDFAIVPEHDFPKASPNLLVTVGAPNMIREELLKQEGSLLLSRFPSVRERRWGLLIGGDDANYTISPSWVEEILVPLLEEAKDQGADVYMTTSRRTLPETEDRIKETTKGFSNVMMLVLGKRDPWNPVPGMLGVCDRIFCTEDSVSMISEAATGGHFVQILRVGKKRGVRKKLQSLTAKMVDNRLLAPGRLWGISRFDLMLESFCRRGLAQLNNLSAFDGEHMIQENGKRILSFNEARRAAEWIIQRWGL